MQKSKSVCSQCIEDTGGCCTDIEISMHIGEATAFMKVFKANKLPKGHKFTPHKGDPEVWEYESNEEACMFLGDDNLCTIYDKRPSICRTYPVQWAKKRKEYEFYLDCTCPLAHRLPLHTFQTWIELLPNPDYIPLIGELDFNKKSRDYINLTVISSRVDPIEIVRDLSLSVS